MKKPAAAFTVQGPSGGTYTGRVAAYFEGYRIQLRRNGRMLLSPSIRDAEFSSFDIAWRVLNEELYVRLGWEKEGKL